MTREFSFTPPNPGGISEREFAELAAIKTRVTLATAGAVIHVTGRAQAECGHSLPVVVKLLVRGRESADVVGLVEDMLRGECEKYREKSSLAACTLTLNLVRSYLDTHTHTCPVEAKEI